MKKIPLFLLIFSLAFLPFLKGFYFPQNLQSPNSQFSSGWFDHTSSVNLCPCQHIQIPLVITNPADNAISIASNFESLGSGLSGYIPSNVFVGSQSSSVANLLVSASCSANSGVSDFSVQFLSNNTPTGQISQTYGSVNVLNCTSLQFLAQSASFSCPSSQTTYYYTLYNSGINSQLVTLQTFGVKNSFISVYPNSLVINPAQSQTITVVFSPPFTYQSVSTDSFSLIANGNQSSTSISSPLKSANCAFVESLNQSNKYLPTSSNNSLALIVSTSQNSNPPLSTLVSGFFFRLLSSTSYVEFFVILLIILLLLYFNQVHYSNQQKNRTYSDNSTQRALKIAQAVDKY